MTAKKNREHVVAEITLSHVIRLGNEQGYPVNRQEALAFFNRDGRAFEMWKCMMQAGEKFIADSFLQQSLSPGAHNGFAYRLWAEAMTLYRGMLGAFRFHRSQYSK